LAGGATERKFTNKLTATASALFLVALEGKRGRREPAHSDRKWPFITHTRGGVGWRGSDAACRA
jgi:hypothetical protein